MFLKREKAKKNATLSIKGIHATFHTCSPFGPLTHCTRVYCSHFSGFLQYQKNLFSRIFFAIHICSTHQSTFRYASSMHIESYRILIKCHLGVHLLPETNSAILCIKMVLWYWSRSRASKAQASLRKCADSPETSLLDYTKYGCRWSFRLKFRPLAPLG